MRMLTAVLVVLALGAFAVCQPPADREPSILVLYDATAQSGHVGSSHARGLVNVLGHFRAECDVGDLEETVEKIKLLGYTFVSLSELDRDIG